MRHYKKHSSKNTSVRKTISLALLAVLTLTIGACGIKPKTLSAPNPNAPDNFPQTYPAVKK